MLIAPWELSAVESKIWIFRYQKKKSKNNNKINEEINPSLWSLSKDIIRDNNSVGHYLRSSYILFHILLR